MNTPDPATAVSEQVLSLQQLIAAPLIATVDADARAAEAYMSHFMNLAFEKGDPGSGRPGRLRMQSFRFLSADAGGAVEKTVSVPLVSLVTLPLFQVREATFDFDINILDAVSSCEQEHFSLKRGDVVRREIDDVPRTELRAMLAPQSRLAEAARDSNLQANMKIHITMQQADMPGGLAQFLNLAARPVSQLPSPAES